jgi:hypothetical protein
MRSSGVLGLVFLSYTSEDRNGFKLFCFDEFMKVRKTLCALGFGGALLFSGGCEALAEKPKPEHQLTQAEQEQLAESNKPIFGNVLESSYIGAGLRTVNQYHSVDVGIFFDTETFSNATVTSGNSHYTLKLETEDGKPIALDVIDGGTWTKEGLAQLLSHSGKIGFRRGNLIASHLDNEGYINDKHYDRGNWLFLDGAETYFYDSTQFGTKKASSIWYVGPTTQPSEKN